jgi:hypothetical protein
MPNNEILDASGFQEAEDYIFKRFRQVSNYIIECYIILKDENRKLTVHKEDEIRNVLVADYLRKRDLKKKYGLGDLRFEPEPGTIDKNYKNTGYIDIKVLNITVGNYGDEDEYFVFECKRLQNKSKSQDYIDKGVIRFINNTYAETMPVAGMIGFIEKSSIKFEEMVVDINNRIAKHNTIAPPKSTMLSPIPISQKVQFTYKSTHDREGDNTPILLGHIFLDFSDIIA